jgi:uncharacterized damage-inducible protein DinB
MITAPKAGTYPGYYEPFLKLVGEKDPFKLLKSSVLDFKALLSEVEDEKENFAYAEGKWTIKEVVSHVIDTERVLVYRAMCFARGEKNSLPGFDEEMYAKNSEAERRELIDLIHEFGSVREGTITLFKTMSDKQLDFVGNANNNPVTPRAILYFLIGHQLHHATILRERYGVGE